MKYFVNSHSSIQIGKIYVDPYNISNESHNAKYVFITHDHYDHLSIGDIKKVMTKNTVFVAPLSATKSLEENFQNKIITVKPNENLMLENIEVEVLPSYNINKNFHKKSFGYVGYKIICDGTVYAIVGDTDDIPELNELKCDVLFVPIGGTYTMNAVEAAKFTNKINPKTVVPVHYNLIVGTKQDEQIFIQNLKKTINFNIFL